MSEAGQTLVSVDLPALTAMRFIARTDAFYVRELPGHPTGADQVTPAATPVERQILRVAP